MKPLMIAAAIVALAVGPASASGRFEGKLELIPAGCEKSKKCKLKDKFGYVDSNGLGWEARAGLETDGASIPDWAQPFIGGQFEKEYIRAAVIHDHYCDRYVRPWRQTHWVFYDALLASGVEKSKALLMYFAVYLGGPKWVKLIKGKPCGTGDNCIQNIPGQQWPAGTRRVAGEGGEHLERPAKYDDPNFAKQLQDAQKFIEARKGDVSPADMEARAQSLLVGDFFFTSRDEITITPAPGIDR